MDGISWYWSIPSTTQILNRIVSVPRDLLLRSADVDKRIDQAIRSVVHTALGMHLHKARADALERLDMRQKLVDPNGGIDSLLHYSPPCSDGRCGFLGRRVTGTVSPGPSCSHEPVLAQLDAAIPGSSAAHGKRVTAGAHHGLLLIKDAARLHDGIDHGLGTNGAPGAYTSTGIARSTPPITL